MRVLHINSYYNGAPLYTHLYDEQINQCVDIDVYVPSVLRAKKYNEFGDYAFFSYDYNQIDRLFYYRKERKILENLKNHFDVMKYDVIHAHSLFTNGYIAYLLNREFGVPYVVAIRNTDLNVYFKRMPHLRHIGLDILKEASKIVFISKPYLEIVKSKYIDKKYDDVFSKKAVVIPNGIDEYWLSNLNTTKSENNNTISLLCVGDIDRNKNQLSVCKACNELERKGYSVHFDLVGRIMVKSIYNKLIMAGAHYLGTAHKEQLLGIYRNHDIFVMPSVHETFGLVYAEAMSQGLPVIYTKNQGFDGQFDEGVVGYHVDSYDYEKMADLIIRIKENYPLISKNCIEMCKRYRWSEIVGHYNCIYEQIIADKR